ncbi:MAG: class I SAM-dependent methyltransferase [Chloroflexota bacterium]|nr:class I SAM-dependent methyltransferase [Chloroflexota bacterium]
MYEKSAAFYDAMSATRRNHAADAEAVRRLIAASATRPVRSLLDVACGTGTHLQYLRAHYDEVVGLDLSAEMLALAAQRLPGVRLVEGDMLTFDLGRKFDSMTCLGSATGYARTPKKLERAVARMAQHLTPGGVLVIEPFVRPEVWEWGRVGSFFVETPSLKIAHFATTGEPGPVANMTFHYLVAEKGQVTYFSEEHALGLFTFQQLVDASRSAGLTTTLDPEGLSGRGLVVGVSASESGTPL